MKILQFITLHIKFHTVKNLYVLSLMKQTDILENIDRTKYLAILYSDIKYERILYRIT